MANFEDLYNALGLEGLRKIIASNPVQFAEQSTSGRVRISPNQVVDLKSGNITQAGAPEPRPQTLTELINVANRIKDPVHGMPREVGGPLLANMVQRFQEEAGLSPQQASLKRLVDLPRREREFAARQGGGRGLPSDLVGAIGTPDFRRQLQDAAGTLDRQSVDTLLDLDRKEREFQVKGVAKPGKLTPAAAKLRELEALGIPITAETVKGIYGDKSPSMADQQPGFLSRLFGAKAKAPATISLSGLAGLAPAADETVAGDEETPAPVDDRRNRLRGRLFGGGGSEY